MAAEEVAVAGSTGGGGGSGSLESEYGSRYGER